MFSEKLTMLKITFYSLYDNKLCSQKVPGIVYQWYIELR